MFLFESLLVISCGLQRICIADLKKAFCSNSRENKTAIFSLLSNAELISNLQTCVIHLSIGNTVSISKVQQLKMNISPKT